MTKNPDIPNGLTDKNVESIVKIGNALLPMLSKNKNDRQKEASVISYLLSDFRTKIISEQGKDVVNHADLFNWSDMKNKTK